ncbi:hypothetical protein PXD56_15990 [Maribacter sp. SA7]|uniref:hypothetical protein n=1 Tax=Maribacter zhoushanensis TaxID=3030012 RepID=UPI0023ECC3A4|nr:hypothetical protein [Maribacter zhoushanensis]MDF4204477.1 hypothetical protein [Maribacter zhoushanensis]
MKSTHTSNNIIDHYRESIPVFPTSGMHETLDNLSCFNHSFCNSNEDECISYVDRSTIDTMVYFKHKSSAFSNHTFSINLKNL